MICDVVITMAQSVLQQKRVLPMLVMLGSFVLVRFWNTNIILVIMICGVIGAGDTIYQEKNRRHTAHDLS